MCVPVLTVAAMAISLAASAAQANQQSRNAAAQQKHADAMAARNSENARANSRNQFAAINDRVFQDATRQGLAAEAVVKDSLAARGRVTAAAAEAGASGASVDQLLNDFSRQEGELIMRTEIANQFTEEQARIDLEATNIGLDSRLLASTPGVVDRPDLFAQSLSAFAGAFSTGISMDQAVLESGGETLFLGPNNALGLG